MDKLIYKIILGLLLLVAIVVCFISELYAAVYILGTALLLQAFIVWNYIKYYNEKQELERFVMTFNHSGHGHKLLVQENSEFKDIIVNVNGIIDTYEQMRIDKKLQATNSKQLLSNLSHDIRTPLTSIIGYVDALNDGIITTEEEMKEFIQILSMKSKNLKLLTDQIFNVARIDADDVAMNLEYIELNDFLRNIIIDFIPQIDKLQLALYNEISDERYMIHADRVALTRIFQNIIKNSLQHGKDGKVIGIRSFMANDYYRVIIWDRGKGIPKAKQDYIFERLFKVDDSRKIGSSNSGLGMAIAKKLIQKHDGNIFLKSEENQLTEFFIELPILKELMI